MAKSRRRPSREKREFYVYELDPQNGMRVPAKKPVQWAVSPKQAVGRVRYAEYRQLSYGDLAGKGVTLVAEEKKVQDSSGPKEVTPVPTKPPEPPKPPVQATFQF